MKAGLLSAKLKIINKVDSNPYEGSTLFTGDEKDIEVTRAYESLLLLTLRQPDNPEYEAFAEQVKVRAKRDYGYEFDADEKVWLKSVFLL